MTGFDKIPQQWRTTLIALPLAMGGVLLLYWQTYISIVSIWWRSETYAHGFLVVPISAWLVWNKRHKLAQLEPKPALSMLWVIGALGAAWLIALSVEIVIVQQLCVVGILIGSIVAMIGWRAARSITFPLAFLILAVPMGEDLLSPLMHFTAAFTVKALKLTGIPVFSEGMYITLPNGRWEVAEACSGLRYLIASGTLGLLYAYLMYKSYWRRIVFVAFSIVVPIIANGIRAYMIVMIGYLSDMRLAVGIDHIIYGWVLFGIIIGIMFYVGSFWREDLAGPQENVRANNGPSISSKSPLPAKRAVIAALGVSVFALIWPIVAISIAGETGVVVPIHLKAPALDGGWTVSQELWAWKPRYLSPQGYLHQSYGSSNGVVNLYLEYYRDQRQGAELIDSQNVLVAQLDPQWHMVSDKKITIQLDGRPVSIHEVHIDSPSVRLLVWQWDWINGYSTINDYLAKLLEAKDKLYEGRTRSASIILATDDDGGLDVARKRLKVFVREMYPSIEKSLKTEGETSPGRMSAAKL